MLSVKFLSQNTLVKHLLDICTPLLSGDGAEQDIHILERHALRLLDEKEDKQAIAEAETTEHDECAVADVVHSARRELSDAEVEEPLRGCTHADTVGTKAGREDLREVHPRNGPPRCTISNNIEVDHDHHSNGGGGDDIHIGRWVGLEDGTNNEHHDHHPRSAEEERLASAKLVDTDD